MLHVFILLSNGFVLGSLEMKVAILANSANTTMNGTFTIYRCDTFERYNKSI
jgi:hypothetical protein